MPNIRYVCLSDLHLGEEDSLLTHINSAGEADPSSTSPVMETLAACLAGLVKLNGPSAIKPTLVLNGDLLELALGDMDNAALVFRRFLSLVMPADHELFGEIIFLPGNHDHHLWEMARETQYLNYMTRLGNVEDLAPPWHTTKVFMDMNGKDRLASDFLTAIARTLENLKHAGVEVLTAYPNFGVLSDDGRRCAIFHHGHFIEPLYRLMSTAGSLVFSDDPLPADVYELEGENFAWIDFFWSAMGRSGKVGREVESIYEATNDEESLARLTDSLAANLAKRYDLPVLWGDWAEEQALRLFLRYALVRRVAAKLERQRKIANSEAAPLSESGVDGLRWYVERMLVRQAETERGPLPGNISLIFGHTHKPFQRVMDFTGFSRGIKVLNTGGWVVDTVDRDPAHGAAIAILDENLNPVSIRLYNEDRFSARVEEPLRAGESRSPLFELIRQVVDPGQEPWRSFADTAAREVERRAANLRARITGH